MDVFEFFSMPMSPIAPRHEYVLTRQIVMADGFGKDIWTLTPEQITNVVKVSSHRQGKRERG